MQLKLFTGLILILLLIVPATAAPPIPYQKIVIINLAYENGNVKEVSSEIQYGTAPNLNLQSGSISGLLQDSQKNTVDEFSIRDPRIQTGDTAETGTGGTLQGLVGYTGYNPDVEFGVIVPFTPDLRYVTLVDSLTGNTLISVDLAGPLSAFQQMYPADPDIQSIPQPSPAGAFPVPARSGALFGIALIIISGAGYFILVRRPQPIQVLVVDDEPAVVDVISVILSQKGYVPVPAQSGKECLSILKTQKKLPDLILLDIMMVPMDGWQTLEKIKKDPVWKKIPVLMLSGNKLTAEAAKQYNICIDDYITKPFHVNEIYAAIDSILTRKQKLKETLVLAKKAGIEKEKFCEFATLTRRISMNKKILDILGVPQAVPVPADMDTLDDMLVVNYISVKTRDHEKRAEQLRQEINSAFRSKGIPELSW
jgi:DNA-binding response OmpR family regulator